MSEVVVLRQEEPLRLDPERLADMFIDLGEARAAHLVGLSTRRLEGLIEELEQAALHRRAGECTDRAEQIAALADALGLISLSGAAGGVGRAARAGDGVALAATLARLNRVALRSFRIAAELEHRSG